MRDDTRQGRITEAEVEARLADAGRVLLALPWAGCFPCGYRVLWPETESARPRHPVPSSHRISAMDEAYRWTAFIPDVDERRLVLMRSLVLPESAFGSPRYVWSWGRLRRATGVHPDTLKKRWGRGIGRIVAGLNRPPPSALLDWPQVRGPLGNRRRAFVG